MQSFMASCLGACRRRGPGVKLGIVPRASTAASQALTREEQGRVVVIRLVKAKLERNLHHMAKLDPYALVLWISASGCRRQISRTAVHVDGHMTPHWDHICRGQRFRDSDTIEVQVWDKDLFWHDMHGKATVKARGARSGRQGREQQRAALSISPIPKPIPPQRHLSAPCCCPLLLKVHARMRSALCRLVGWR